MLPDLQAAIAECLSLHAQAVEKLGTEYPERLPRVPAEIRAKITRQRDRVSNTLSGVAPEEHIAELESLNAGLRLILKRLCPVELKLPAPPQPVWDAATKAWRVPATDAKTRIAELARHFDEQGPDDPNKLFRD